MEAAEEGSVDSAVVVYGGGSWWGIVDHWGSGVELKVCWFVTNLVWALLGRWKCVLLCGLFLLGSFGV